VVVQIPVSTVSELADTVAALKKFASPVKVAVTDRTPSVRGVHEHVAKPELESTARAEQPSIATPFSINATVPDVPVASLTVATKV
jgi:hypothetical protein